MRDGFNYTEIVLNGVQNRGCVKELKADPDFYGKPDYYDCYMSAYRFNSDFKKFADENKTVRGYAGICHCENLFFDFDSPHGDLALEEVREFIGMVIEKDQDPIIEDINIYFSGNKGFHVFIKQNFDPSIDLPDIIKKYCFALAKKYSTFDRAVYDKTRIIRIPNSKHRKSGLYKIPLLPGEVFKLSTDDIRVLAKKQRSINDAVKQFSERFLHGIA